jgi:anti-sigma factor ChrR (cupin superfamily)
MNADLADLLALHALGLLDADEAAEVERRLAAEPALADELAALRRTAALLVVAPLPVMPPAAVQARLLASIAADEAGPLTRFAARFARLFDVPVGRGRELLTWVASPTRWEAFGPGIEVIHFAAGPACAGADTGFVRIAAGARFPWHRHRGEEVSLIVAGRCRDHTGAILVPGDELWLPVDAAHEIFADGDQPLVFAVRVFVGIEIEAPPPLV